MPDSNKWNYDTIGNSYGWGNNELQWYTSKEKRNAEVKDGRLFIRAYKETINGKNYSSARLTTKHKGDWKYCRVEVRAKLPKGRGTWPAIWMLPTHNVYGGWPKSGEIDIMEHVGYDPDSVFSTSHTENLNHMKRTQVGKSIYLPGATTDFQVYAMEWDENEFRSYVNGKHYFTFKNTGHGPKDWPYDQDFHLILNLAIGGGLGGKKGIDTTQFPHLMEVDYVRVYKPDTTDVAFMIKNRNVADSNIVIPPSWAFGVLYGAYTNQQQTIERIQEIKKRDYPIDAYWIDSWFWDHANKGKGPQKYIDFIADTIGFPDRKGMWKFLEQNNIKGGFWVWDLIQETGNEAAFKEFKDKGFFKSIYNNSSSWHNSSTTTAMFEEGNTKRATPTGNIDFNNPEAVALFKQRMKHFFDEGADFIKLDNTSAIEICKAMFEMTQELGKETKGRGFILSHTGGQERPEYKRYPTKWTDDTRSDWTIETPLLEFNSWVPKVALKENIAMHLDPAKKSSDIPFLTNDLGGFDMGKTTQPEEELYIRWMQFSMMNAITEIFSQPENPTANMAWNYGNRADSLFRKYAHLRMQFFPYIYSNAHLARIAGKHILGKIPGYVYQYTLGDNILLAPVYEKGAVSQNVFLPEGDWVNYWTGERMEGNRNYTVAAPLEQIPMFMKSGSIIPIRNYASSIEQGNNSTLTLEVYPGADGSFFLIEDDGSSNGYLKGVYAATLLENKFSEKTTRIIVRPVDGYYDGMPDKRTWKIHLKDGRKPLSVTCNGKRVKFTWGKDNLLQIVLKERKVSEEILVEIKYP
ncbi:MAG: family 16 glycosylhydrolase [Chitinophagaceae bacterium]|nr:family 16 glycosylhydrolase [Chitinophagaceae bacterium]